MELVRRFIFKKKGDKNMKKIFSIMFCLILALTAVVSVYAARYGEHINVSFGSNSSAYCSGTKYDTSTTAKIEITKNQSNGITLSVYRFGEEITDRVRFDGNKTGLATALYGNANDVVLNDSNYKLRIIATNPTPYRVNEVEGSWQA